MKCTLTAKYVCRFVLQDLFLIGIVQSKTEVYQPVI